MSLFSHEGLDSVVANYGYLAVALGVGLESMGQHTRGPMLLKRWRSIVAASGVALVLPNAEPRAISHECASSGDVIIAAVGDVIFQPELGQLAQAEGIPYRSFWSAVESVIARADLAYANVEGPVTASTPGAVAEQRTSALTLNFSYSPSLLENMKASGFDVVSTANNHALDRGGAGVDETIANLDKSGLAFTGTRKRGEQGAWSTLTRAKGLTVAWLACTYGTNGTPDLHRQVLSCFQQQDEVLAEIRRLVANPSIDAVIFTPHWGIEYSRVIERRQRDLARAAIEAGALAVIGTHPHVLQEWQSITANDGRKALVIYSTGNFISAQRGVAERTGIIAILSLGKGAGEAKAHLSAAHYILTRIVDTPNGPRVVEASEAGVPNPLPPAGRLSNDDFQGECRGKTDLLPLGAPPYWAVHSS